MARDVLTQGASLGSRSVVPDENEGSRAMSLCEQVLELTYSKAYYVIKFDKDNDLSI